MGQGIAGERGTPSLRPTGATESRGTQGHCATLVVGGFCPWGFKVALVCSYRLCEGEAVSGQQDKGLIRLVPPG